jgi:hypothetical protein
MLCFCLSVVPFLSSKAQTNFLKGYYINSAHDTVRGFIEYRMEERNDRICVFKSEVGSKAVALGPEQVLGYSIDDKVFYEKHSFTGKRGGNAYGFFRVLIRGRLSLLRINNRYFAKDSLNKLFEISKRQKNIDGKIGEDYSGMGILTVLMRDCSHMTSSYLGRAYHTSPDYVNIFKEYYSCTKAPVYVAPAISMHPEFDFGVQASTAISRLTLHSRLANATFNDAVNVGIGAFSSVFIPRVMTENIRLLGELNFGFLSHYAYFVNEGTYNDVFLDYNYLETPLLLRYRGKRIFLDAGYHFTFFLNQHVRWRIETTSLSHVVQTTDEYVPPLSPLAAGYVVGIGIRYQVAGYPVRTSVRLSDTHVRRHEYSPEEQSLQLIVSVQLTK